MQLTDRQREAVDHRGSHLVVSASAGSGKTAVLASRCVELIVDERDPCPVDRLLVVTFTRAAAAELRVRIAEALRARAAELDAAARELRGAARERFDRLAAHARRQVRLIDAAEIGTIDAWCGRIVREHFDAAGVDPGFVVLSPADAQLLRKRVLDEQMGEIYRGTGEREAAAREWLRRGTGVDDGFFRSLIERLNRFRENVVDPAAWSRDVRAAHAPDESALRTRATAVLAAALRDECAAQADQLQALLEIHHDDAEALGPYRIALREWRDALASPAALTLTVESLASFSLKKTKGKSYSSLFDEVRERWLKRRLAERWSGEIVRGLIDGAAPAAALVRVLLDVEERFEAALHDAKSRRGTWEFGDVQRAALNVLGRPGGAGFVPTPPAERLRRRYRHILVDEVQDTSPVQFELIRLVARHGDDGGNCFFVGDVKQSIYGFRQAEPRLVSDLIAAYERGAGGAVCNLSDNFRSHAALVAGFNEMFSRLIEPALGGTEFGEAERLCARRQELANPSLDAAARIELCVVSHASERDAAPPNDESDDDPLEPERIEREAALAAEQIEQLLAARAQIPQRGPGGEPALRPIELRDVAVLLRAAARNAALVARVFRQRGIACQAGARESLLDSIEVGDLRGALTLLANRRQDLALAAHLRGPMVGVSAEQLLRIREFAPRPAFWEAARQYAADGPDDALRKTLSMAQARLDAWRVAARDGDLPALLRRILADTQFPHVVRGLRGGEHRTAQLHALLKLAEQFSADGRRGPAEFVAHLDALEAQELETASAQGENVVRIMTVHAAKGLEFPVVFLLNAGARFNDRGANDPLQLDRRGGLGLRVFDCVERREFVTADHVVLRRQRRVRDREEELRLLYVAMTRAREKLVVIGHAPADRRDELRQRYGPLPGKPPLLARLDAASALDWLLMAAASDDLLAATHAGAPLLTVRSFDAVEVRPAPTPAAPGERDESIAPELDDAAQDRWMSDAERRLRFRPASRLSRLPAVLSVSAIKQLARRADAADGAASPVRPAGALHDSDLAPPRFLRSTAPAGTDVGTAYHRFLQYARLDALATIASIREQLAMQVAAGRLTAEEAALVDPRDIEWLAGTAEGRLLAGAPAGAVHRETPFVCALPVDAGGQRAVVRGTIDCLIETAADVTLLDYKTDLPRDEEDQRARSVGYSVQVGLYCAAAAALLGRPVDAAALVYLRARRVVPVEIRPPSLADLLETTSDADWE